MSFILFFGFGSKYAPVHRYGTVFSSEVDLKKKRLGMGVINGFIGGFAAIICGGHYRVINGFKGGFGCHIGSNMVICGSEWLYR